MNYENRDRELNLKALCYSIARRWRQMLVIALIFAVALGAFRAWKSLSVIMDPETLAVQQKAYEENYDRYIGQAQTLMTKIAMVEEDISQQGKYLEESVLMQINHRNAWLATVSIYIQAGEHQQVSATKDGQTLADIIADAYRVALVDSRLLEKAAEALDMEVKYLRELIDVPYPVEDERQQGPLVTVVVRGQNAQSAQRTADALLSCLELFQEEFRKSLGSHTVHVVTNTVSSAVDEELADIQEDATDRLLEYTSVLEDYQFSLQQLVAPSMPDLSMTSMVKSVIKYAAVGFICGIFLVAVWGCVSFVAGDKVYSAAELKNRFNLTILGCAALKKRKCCIIDRWLDRIEGRGRTEADGAFGVITANVRNHSQAGQTLLIAGTAGEEAVNRIADAVSAALTDRTIIRGGSLLDSVDAIQGLGCCDAVILVERCGVSRYALVKSQIEAISAVDQQLLGCVTLEK